MDFCIKISSNEVISLPSSKNLQERIELCERLINEFPQHFIQEPNHAGGQVGSVIICARLEAMANYILTGVDNNVEYPVITRYREIKQRNNEVTFSDLEKRYDNMED